MVYKYFDKKSSRVNNSRGAVKSEIMSSHELAEELHKPVTRKFEKPTVNSL